MKDVLKYAVLFPLATMAFCGFLFSLFVMGAGFALKLGATHDAVIIGAGLLAAVSGCGAFYGVAKNF